jgi:hypothetical protein
MEDDADDAMEEEAVGAPLLLPPQPPARAENIRAMARIGIGFIIILMANL